MKRTLLFFLFWIIVFQICWSNNHNSPENDKLGVSIIGSQKNTERPITNTFVSPNAITNTFTGSHTIFVSTTGIAAIAHLSEVALYDDMTMIADAQTTNLTTPQSFTATFSNLDIPSQHWGNLSLSAWVENEEEDWEQLLAGFMVTETVPGITSVTPPSIETGIPIPLSIETQGLNPEAELPTDIAPFGMVNSETNEVITSTLYNVYSSNNYVVTMTLPAVTASENWILYMLFNQNDFDYNINHDIIVEESSTPEDEITPENSHSTLLKANYPNPFNPTTTIEFSLQCDSEINLSIYNINGQKIKTLAQNKFTKGTHSIIWNGKDESGKPVTSGVYLYQLDINDKTKAVKKCLLLK